MGPTYAERLLRFRSDHVIEHLHPVGEANAYQLEFL